MQRVDRDSTPAPQLLFMPAKDPTRLLKVYVKRSLSFNDCTHKSQWTKIHQWGSLTEKHNKDQELDRVTGGLTSSNGPAMEASGTAHTGTATHDSTSEPQQRSKESHKKNKKPSLLKNFLGLFSRTTGEKKEEDREERERERRGVSTSPERSPSRPRPSKRLRMRASRRRFSLKTRTSEEAKFPAVKRTSGSIRSNSEVMPEVTSLEPTISYYENVSDELAKIVKEVRTSPTDECCMSFTNIFESKATTTARENEVMEEIVKLLKQQGDYINKELSYSSFQHLVDCYVQAETPKHLPPGTGSPELVRFAVTLDFTAKLAGLSSQAVGRIMGFGNQYLQDRFTQMSLAHESTNLESHDMHYASLD